MNLQSVYHYILAVRGRNADLGASPANTFSEVAHYLNRHQLDNALDILYGFGVVNADDAFEWFYDYFVADENEGKAKAQTIKAELSNIDPDALYMSNPSLNMYNRRGFTPEHVEEADDDDIRTSLNQLCDYLEHNEYEPQ